MQLEDWRENRVYFEEGCACIHREKTLEPCPAGMTDAAAVKFYEDHCQCSRNYAQKENSQ